jgi:beta-fructofuranosidase
MFFGWIADREGSTDRGAWRWGGDFALPREVIETSPGQLAVRLPSVALEPFVRELPSPAALRLGAPGRTEHVFLDVDHHAIDGGYVLECQLQPASDVAEFGLLFRVDDDLVGYAVTFDRGRDSVALSRWPPPASPPWETSMGHGSAPEVDGPRLAERPLPTNASVVVCRLVVEDSLLEIFVDDVVALSYRVYQRAPHELGWYVSDGELDVTSISVRAQPGRLS